MQFGFFGACDAVDGPRVDVIGFGGCLGEVFAGFDVPVLGCCDECVFIAMFRNELCDAFRDCGSTFDAQSSAFAERVLDVNNQQCPGFFSHVSHLATHHFFRAACASSYRSRFETPASSAISVMTVLNRSPASTRSSTRGASSATVYSRASAPDTTIVISPRTPSAAHCASSPSSARRTSS